MEVPLSTVVSDASPSPRPMEHEKEVREVARNSHQQLRDDSVVLLVESKHGEDAVATGLFHGNHLSARRRSQLTYASIQAQVSRYPATSTLLPTSLSHLSSASKLANLQSRCSTPTCKRKMAPKSFQDNTFTPARVTHQHHCKDLPGQEAYNINLEHVSVRE